MSKIIKGISKLYNRFRDFPFKSICVAVTSVLSSILLIIVVFGWKAALALIIITIISVLFLLWKIGDHEAKAENATRRRDGDRRVSEIQDAWLNAGKEPGKNRKFRGPQ